ncbi:MAG: SipW-dependent-type signal peptide-containing protein [Bacillota bacterium]|nr:SipW-dependent-type signal peptide-containing protein [Bacillota bacterium]
MKRRNAVLTAALALLVALVAFGTAAYFSGEAHVTNVITTGKIDITLKEQTKDAAGNPIKWPSEGITGVMPGKSVDKLVSVESVAGSSDAWVRVKVESTITAADGKTDLPTKDMLDFDFKPGWIPGAGGYYYYSVPLSAGQTTPELFTKVTFAPGMPNEYQGCTVNVKVTAQAVQKKNNDAKGSITELTAENYAQIEGWPAE